MVISEFEASTWGGDRKRNVRLANRIKMAKKDKIRKFTHNKNSYSVILPNNKIRRESDSIFAKTYRESIKNGYFLEAEVEDILKQRGYDEKKVNKIKSYSPLFEMSDF